MYVVGPGRHCFYPNGTRDAGNNPPIPGRAYCPGCGAPRYLSDGACPCVGVNTSSSTCPAVPGGAGSDLSFTPDPAPEHNPSSCELLDAPSIAQKPCLQLARVVAWKFEFDPLSLLLSLSRSLFGGRLGGWGQPYPTHRCPATANDRRTGGRAQGACRHPSRRLRPQLPLGLRDDKPNLAVLCGHHHPVNPPAKRLNQHMRYYSM